MQGIGILHDYQKRYGFVSIDRDENENTGTLNRYTKDSYDWYKKVIASNGEELDGVKRSCHTAPFYDAQKKRRLDDNSLLIR